MEPLINGDILDIHIVIPCCCAILVDTERIGLIQDKNTGAHQRQILCLALVEKTPHGMTRTQIATDLSTTIKSAALQLDKHRKTILNACALII